MNKFVSLTALAVAAGILSFNAVAGNNLNGNGAPSGAHYNLNIIGMENPKGKTEEETIQSNGRRIFVSLSGKTKIMLTEGDFDVIDYDGTDGTAIFQLPNPDPDCDGETVYSVYARALGGGGSATMTSCLLTDGSDLDLTTDEFCSIGSEVVVLDRSEKGKSSFENVSRQLLYVTADLGWGIKRYPLFSYSTWGYWWDYDNNGLRLAQLRFYEIPTDVGDAYPIDQGGDNCDLGN